MEIPLTPMEFARRARRLYSNSEAVIDGPLRLTYGQFFERCDRWSSALQSLGVARGDRVVYIAPNTHAQLESFYAVPQIGAVLVPLNLPSHRGRLRLHDQPLRRARRLRARRLSGGSRRYPRAAARRRAFRRARGLAPGLARLRIDAARRRRAAFAPVEIDERDLLTINYTSGTTSRPKGVMITHRNAYMNAIGTLVHLPMTPADRYLWTLPMFHANGWTFTWIVTAVGATHVCLRKVDPAVVFQLIATERVTMLCAAPTVLISLANAPEEARRHARPAAFASSPPAPRRRPPRSSAWKASSAGRSRRCTGLTETAPFITVCEPRPEHATLPAEQRAAIKARQGVELDHLRRAAGRGRRRDRGAARRRRRSARSSSAATS